RILAAANRPLRLLPAPWLVGGLALAVALAWWAVLSHPHGRLTVSIMDVGQGDAIFVHTPQGHQILIDGGPSAQAAMEALGRELPFWDRSLDLIVLTHPQEDHLVGLVRVLERYDVAQVMASPIEADSSAYDEWRRLIEEKDIPYLEATAGAWVDLGDSATLHVLGPPQGGLHDTQDDLNNNSLVLKLSWGRLSFLLTGDIESEAEDALLDSRHDLRAAVLKVPHHGSAHSSSKPFLEAVRPALTVISVGEDNTFGHPSPTTLARLTDTLLYRTDQHGRLRLSTDGQRLWVSPDRTP
ncbi:MAG: MBL fold metallo-hydrolase, partial [Dehalococcoidia bacterium]